MSQAVLSWDCFCIDRIVFLLLSIQFCFPTESQAGTLAAKCPISILWPSPGLGCNCEPAVTIETHKRNGKSHFMSGVAQNAKEQPEHTG